MRGLVVLSLLVAFIVLVSSEVCQKSSDCQETTCVAGSDVHLGCSDGMCTCYKRNDHGIGCRTQSNCAGLHCDEHRAHCIDSYCHCGSKHND